VFEGGLHGHGLDALSELHFDHTNIQYKDVCGSGKSQIRFAEVDVEKALDYAAEDADMTFRLYKKFHKSLKEEKMINIYEVFEKPMINILAFMEIEGIKVDNEFLKILSLKFEKKIQKIQKDIFKIFRKHHSTIQKSNRLLFERTVKRIVLFFQRNKLKLKSDFFFP
jgi:DNA polymerase-1